MTHISRRDFLIKLAALLPLGMSSAGLILSLNSPKVEKIELSNRTTLNIVLGKHGYNNLSAFTDQIPEDPVINADYLVLEGLTFNKIARQIPPNYNGNIELTNPINFSDIFLKQDNWYNQLPQILDKRKNNPPFIVGVDPSLRINNPLVYVCINVLIPYFVQLFGAENLSRHFSKREFLQSIPALLLYVWGNTAFGRYLVDFLQKFSKEEIEKTLAEIGADLQLTHPENIVLVLRNLTIAEKLLFLAEQTDNSNITLLIGERHKDIVPLLIRGREFCLNMLKRFYPDDIREFLLNEPLNYDRIFICKPGTTEIRVITDPNLSFRNKEGQLLRGSEIKG